MSEAPCFDPECSRSRCREQNREREADLNQKAERARLRWQRAKDQQEAAVRALRELFAEKNAEREAAGEGLLHMPRGPAREDLIAKMLASERQADRFRRHLNISESLAVEHERDRSARLPE